MRGASSRNGGQGPIACVLGEVDLVRALALGKVRCAVVARPGNPARYSRGATAVVERLDPWKQADALVGRLLEFAATQPEPPVLFFDADWDLLLVSRHRDRLSPAFRFAVAGSELIESLVDKSRFETLARELELPVPRGVRLAPDAPPSAVDLRFPLIAKPLTRQQETWRPLARAKAVQVASPTELEGLWERLAGSGLELLLQELVPGDESRIESYHVYVDEAREVAAEFTGRKLRTYPAGFGYTTALTITDVGDVRDLGREVVRRIGLQGVAKLDFKRDPEGRLHLLEINPRFNLWHHPGALAGVNLPLTVYCDLTGRARPAPARIRPGVEWCSLAHDLQAARAAGMSSASWLRWVVRCDAKSGFAPDDPLPLPRAAAYRLGRYARARLAGAGKD